MYSRSFLSTIRTGSVKSTKVQAPTYSHQVIYILISGAYGLTKVIFAPDSRHLLAFSDFQLRISIYSLLDSSAPPRYLQFPKYSDRAFGYRSDGLYFGMAERIEGKEYITILDCADWEMLKVF